MPTGIPKSGINKGWFKKSYKRIITPQMIENYRKANLGSKNPMFGKKPWNKNKITPQEIRDKISFANKGHSAWNKGKKLHYQVWNKGIKRPEISGKNHWKWKGGEKRFPKCIDCGKKTSRINATRCHKCDSRYKSEERHWNWQGGITPKHYKIRRSEKYQQWRLLVYKRDHYTCQKCGQKHIDIVAHHIKSFVEFEKLRFKVVNGKTLCRVCHARLHKLSIL